MGSSQHSPTRTVGAGILIGIGLMFLVTQLLDINLWEMFSEPWPMFIVIPGVVMLFIGIFGDKKAAGLVMPGMIVSGTGLILGFQNTFNYYESWAYMWALYPIFTGIGLILLGNRTDSAGTAEKGRLTLRGGLVMFAIFGAMFELFIFNDGDSGRGDLMRLLIPVVLIVAGAIMLFGRGRPAPDGGKPKNDEKIKHGGVPLQVVPPPDDPAAPSINPELQRRIDAELGRNHPEGIV